MNLAFRQADFMLQGVWSPLLVFSHGGSLKEAADIFRQAARE
jgi:hypothetical protein